MGITQHTHGTDNVMAVANLALLTGQIGKPSTGINPLRGQNNVQGACDMGGLPNVYPGYQQVSNPEIQAKFEKAWGRKLSNQNGLTHTEIFDAIYDGRITALYLVGENPLLTEANAKHVREALEKLDFFVVQDLFISETAQFADVIFPAASFAEKSGTFTNTERRVQRVRQAISPRGDSRPDWWSRHKSPRRWENPDLISPALRRLWPKSGLSPQSTAAYTMNGWKDQAFSGLAGMKMTPARLIHTRAGSAGRMVKGNSSPWHTNNQLKFQMKSTLSF
jgi:predicted molibdopterin-dependent oxidoreductase YjgC